MAKTAVDKVKEKFQALANQLFEEIGEVKSVALIVDWNIGKRDFPPGQILTRNNPTIDEMISLFEQLSKMTYRLMEVVAEGNSSIQKQLQEIERQLHEKDTELRNRLSISDGMDRVDAETSGRMESLAGEAETEKRRNRMEKASPGG